MAQPEHAFLAFKPNITRLKMTSLINFFTISAIFFGVDITRGLSGELPKGFVHLSDVAPHIDVNMRYLKSNNFIGEPIPGYESNTCILTRQAAEALKSVQKKVRPFGLTLTVFDCYRPQKSVDYFMSWTEKTQDIRKKAQYYPDITKKDLVPKGYIAAKSGHSRGSTVDLNLAYDFRSGSKRSLDLLDMGTAFDFFGLLSHTLNKSISNKARKNRLLLKTLMEEAGFKGLKEEWWHFTLKDEPFKKKYFNFLVKK